MPKIGGMGRPHSISEVCSISQDAAKHGPVKLPAGTAEGAAVNGLSFRPKSTATGIPEEVTRLDVHSFAFPAGNQEEDEDDQLVQGKLTCAGEVLGRLLKVRIKIFRDQVNEFWDKFIKLA